MTKVLLCRRCDEELPPNITFVQYLIHRFLVCVPKRGR